MHLTCVNITWRKAVGWFYWHMQAGHDDARLPQPDHSHGMFKTGRLRDPDTASVKGVLLAMLCSLSFSERRAFPFLNQKFVRRLSSTPRYWGYENKALGITGKTGVQG